MQPEAFTGERPWGLQWHRGLLAPPGRGEAETWYGSMSLQDGQGLRPTLFAAAGGYPPGLGRVPHDPVVWLFLGRNASGQAVTGRPEHRGRCPTPNPNPNPDWEARAPWTMPYP